MTSRSEIGRMLAIRLGQRGQDLNVQLAIEEQQARRGLREPDEPSAALTAIHHHLSRADFTPDERARIRLAAGIDVLEDIGLG